MYYLSRSQSTGQKGGESTDEKKTKIDQIWSINLKSFLIVFFWQGFTVVPRLPFISWAQVILFPQTPE